MEQLHGSTVKNNCITPVVYVTNDDDANANSAMQRIKSSHAMAAHHTWPRAGIPWGLKQQFFLTFCDHISQYDTLEILNSEAVEIMIKQHAAPRINFYSYLEQSRHTIQA